MARKRRKGTARPASGSASAVAAPHDPAAEAAERRDRAILLAILAAAFLLATAFPVSIQVMDELEYIRVAQDYARGTLPAENTFYARRLGLLLPMAAAFRIFGDGEPVYRFIPMLAYLGNIVIAFRLARRAIGGRAGVIAAALAAIFPMAYWQSTVPNTDMVFAFWLNLSLAVLLVARERSEPGPVFRGAFASGVLLGAASLTKLMALGAAPVILLFVLPCRRRVRLFAGILAGFAAVFAAECALSAVLFGGPFSRWPLAMRTHFWNESIADRLVGYPKLLFNPLDFRNAWVGLHHALALAAAGWAIFRKDARVRPFWIWWAVCLVVVAYGTSSFRTWRPFVNTHPRFLSWIAMPAHILGAWAIVRTLAWTGIRRRLAIAAAAALAAHSILLCVILHRDSALQLAALRRTARRLGDRPLPEAVYTDWASARALTAFLGLDPGFAVIDYQTIKDWRGRRGLIIDNEALRGHPMVAGRQLEAGSTGAHCIARVEVPAPWRLSALLGIGPDVEGRPSACSVWELPDGPGSAPRR
ncbi:MAG: glycosyltransferase family 39 protein [Planctomycetes bacterium]|nr:glycosyltransferase family 39 protein [Planctomycetota bacterium]